MIKTKFTDGAFEYYDSIRDIRINEDYISTRDKIFSRMEAVKREHPDLSATELKCYLYETVAELFEPVLLPYCPFYFEMGLRSAKTWGGGEVAGWNHDQEIVNAHTLQRHIKELGYIPAEHPGSQKEPPEGYLGIALGGVFDTDHHCIGYTKIFDKGILGIIGEIDAILETEPVGNEKYKFNTCAKRGLLSLLKIAGRFQAAAQRKLQSCTDPEEQYCLNLIQETAGRVPANPPRTFYEGLAALLFLREVIATLDGKGISVLGHADRLLGPLYEQDIESGRITREEAVGLLEKWLCIPDIRCNPQLSYWADNSTCVELGGCDQDGNTVFNEVTELVITTHERLNLINPKLNCRMSRNSPGEYLCLIAGSLKRGHNVFALINDDVVIPALCHTGRELQDARLYVNGGCQETIVEGCEHSAGVAMYFILPRVLDLSLNPVDTTAYCQQTIDNLPKVIEQADTFEVFYGKYLANMKNMLSYAADIRRPFGEKYRDVCPSPIFSATLKGCLESGKDYTAGGAKYNLATFSAVGFATLTDSLYAIKKAVYDEKIVTLSQLRQALAANWVGYELLREKMLRYPKFGHDITEADTFAARVFRDLNDHAMTIDNERCGKYIFSTFTYAHFWMSAPHVRATPDGRTDKDYMSQSIGPSRLQKIDSITKPINSLRGLDLDKSGGISVLDVILPTSSNLSEEVLASLFLAFAANGGQALNPNHVSVAQLRAAQKDPQAYQNLTVRLHGLSVYFVKLPKEFQNEVIARNMYHTC